MTLRLALSMDVLVIGALAVWYIVHTLTGTHGPLDIFKRFRERFPLGGLMLCPKCLAFWVAIVFVLLILFDVVWIAYPFAIAGGAVALGALIGLL